MPERVYVSGDVNVNIGDDGPLSVDVLSADPLVSEMEDIVIAKGGLPPGGDAGDLIVKTSSQKDDAEWKTIVETGLRHVYYDLTQNWDAKTTLISEEGAIYSYGDYSEVDGKKVPAVKIGDGSAYLIDIPFVSENLASLITSHIADTSIHVTASEKEFWNNKVNAVLDSSDRENLILTRLFVIGGNN